MCTCTHGSDRHFLDYAGPGVAGGILTRCMEPGCECLMFTNVIEAPVTLIFPNQTLQTGGGQ